MSENLSKSFASFSLSQAADGQWQFLVKSRFAIGDLVEFDNQLDKCGRGEISAINLYDDCLCSFQIDNSKGLYCDDQNIFYEIYGDQMLLLMTKQEKLEASFVPGLPLPKAPDEALQRLLTVNTTCPIIPPPKPPGDEFIEYKFNAPYSMADMVYSDANPLGNSRVYAITYSESEDLKYGVRTASALFFDRPVSAFTFVRKAPAWIPAPERRDVELTESTEAFNAIRQGGDGKLEESSNRVIKKLDRYRRLETVMLLLKYPFVTVSWFLYLFFCVFDIAAFLVTSNKWMIEALERDHLARVALLLIIAVAPMLAGPLAHRLTRSVEGYKAIYYRGSLFFCLIGAIIALTWAVWTGLSYLIVTVREY